MSEAYARNYALFEQLQENPDDEALLARAARELYQNPLDFAKAAEDVLPEPPSMMMREPPQNEWSNCVGNQVCEAKEILHPKSLQNLLDAVERGRKESLKVRAVGSGHSYSDVAVTNGLLLDPHGMNQVLPVDTSVLQPNADPSTLFSVQSGITIHDLNEQLDKRHLALINMGAYDGQTIAGAVSTGTHGTGVGLGPLASNIVSIALVSETGTVYQIEPSNGITDPAKFNGGGQGFVLKQDDDWFQSNVVAMGCMGLVYSYTLRVCKAYNLEENRTATTWETWKSTFGNVEAGKIPAVISKYRHYEIDVNPYAVNGVHAAVVTTRDEVAKKPSGTRGFSNWLSGLLASYPKITDVVVWTFNLFPGLISKAVSQSLDTLVDTNYINKSYMVLNLGAVNNVKAYAIELSLDASSFIPTIDKILSLMQEATAKNWYQAGPLGIRFVQAADAYLAPQYGRITCMVEFDNLYGIKHAPEFFEFIETTMLAIPGVRVHWGLDFDVVDGKEAAAMYPKWDRWVGVYRELNKKGMFENEFTARMGL